VKNRPSLAGPRLVHGLVCALVLALVPLSVTAAPSAAATATTTSEEPVGQWPLDPRPAVVHGFDPPSVTWGSGHRGVDLAGRIGQPVRAALPGVVTYAGRIAGVRIVVVDHGATRTTYQPVAAAVPRGTTVAAGEVIGHLEWFGTHCSPAACLHWGWIHGSEYLDPLRLVGPLPVRLLPLDRPPPVTVSIAAPTLTTPMLMTGLPYVP
jgi:murein DD-endopeptidase MepM/ murein hydrolase activator NlpD